MAPRGMITMTALLLCFILGILSPAPAACNTACCTSYSRRPVPFNRIKGYREQSLKENCRIEAIIFYTVANKQVCATRKDEWVRKTLELLRTIYFFISKCKKLEKAGSDGSKASMSETGNPSVCDGRGYFICISETFLNNTESCF
uniref:Chemokine interleukin-8-like domain-containing protein n=1 Tax=Amphilophus citrinellus TaxID=61819 RepID=A0A3Q0SIR4_AMPCI